MWQWVWLRRDQTFIIIKIIIMDESKNAELLKGMFAGATFYKSVVAGVAESGSTVCYEKSGEQEKREKKVKPSIDQIAKALARVGDLFWGNSSYTFSMVCFRLPHMVRG